VYATKVEAGTAISSDDYRDEYNRLTGQLDGKKYETGYFYTAR
jgi:hypothetical protein